MVFDSKLMKIENEVPLFPPWTFLLVSMHPSQMITQSWKHSLMIPGTKNLRPSSSKELATRFLISMLIWISCSLDMNAWHLAACTHALSTKVIANHTCSDNTIHSLCSV